MKKSLLLSLLLGSASMGLHAQYTILEDLTSNIQNADFTADSPVGTTVRTYDYDMPDAGAASGEEGAIGLYGMQPVTGWTANTPTTNTKVADRTDGTNARAAGVFAYDDESGEEMPGLGGNFYAPYEEQGLGLTSQALGIVAVWGGNPKYTQSISLPAGAYMLIAKIYNAAGTGTIGSNFIGFTTSEGTAFMSNKETYSTQEWVNDTIVFQLEEATEGELSLGFSFGSGSGSAPHLFIDGIKLYSIDTGALIKAEIEAAKAELYDLIQIGQAYNVDVTNALAVYNDANATLEQVQAAIVTQQELNAAGVTDLSEAFITNPHFNQDEPLEGGICTYDYDCEKNNIPLTNYSMLPVTGWERTKTDNGCASGVYAIGSGAFLGGADYIVPTEMSDGSTEGKVLGFVTCWTMAVQYKQNVTLPAGKYTLKMSYFNTGGTTAIDKNLIGFITDEGTEYLAELKTFPVGKWTTEEVSFELKEQTTGYFSLGYKSVNSGSASMPHFFTDGISLVYVGTGIDPTYLALQAVVTRGEAALEKDFNADLKSQLQTVVETAQDLVENGSDDAEANKAATAAINDLLPAVQASIAAYEKLSDFRYGAYDAAYTKYENIESLIAKLEELGDDVDKALEDYDWTTEQIEAAIASLDVIIKEEIQKLFDAAVESGEELEEDLDITVLFDQMAYTYSTSTAQGASVPDKEWQYGDASNFKTQYGTAEVWNQSPFTVSRTLKDMPAGKYTITTKAIYRTADNATNYDNFVANPNAEAKAFLFAGSVKEGLTNVAALASEEEVSGWAQTADASGIYVPNSQQAAHDIFEDEAYASLVEKTVSTALVETGDLTFGITADQLESNSWVVWYSFSIAYNAPTDDALIAELTGIVELLESYLSGEKGTMTAYAESLIADATDNANEALEEEESEAMIAAIAEAKAALAIAEENIKAFEAYTEAETLLNTISAEYEGTASQDAKDDLTAVYERMNGVDELENAELISLTEDIYNVIAALKLPADYKEATDSTPVDFTMMIENNSFEAGDLTGWTYYKGSDTQAADNSNATYTITNADGNYVFNTWNGSAPEGGFYVSQVLKGLPAGAYQLEALLASDEGNTISLTAANGGADYIMETDKATATEASIVFTLDEKSDVEIKASSGNWFKADNFRLTYYGEESSQLATGVAAIEAAPAIAPAAVYTIAGAKVAGLQKGINIVKYTDGTVKKVLVK